MKITIPCSLLINGTAPLSPFLCLVAPVGFLFNRAMGNAEVLERWVCSYSNPEPTPDSSLNSNEPNH